MVPSTFASVAAASLHRVFASVGRFRAVAVPPANATSPRLSQQHRVDQWVRERLVDEAFARYLDWRAESEAVDVAFRVWSRAPRTDGAVPYEAYAAALDREERAATVYRSVIDRVEQLFGGDGQPVRAGTRAAGA
jgi:hypothetical protein